MAVIEQLPNGTQIEVHVVPSRPWIGSPSMPRSAIIITPPVSSGDPVAITASAAQIEFMAQLPENIDPKPSKHHPKGHTRHGAISEAAEKAGTSMRMARKIIWDLKTNNPDSQGNLLPLPELHRRMVRLELLKEDTVERVRRIIRETPESDVEKDFHAEDILL